MTDIRPNMPYEPHPLIRRSFIQVALNSALVLLLLCGQAWAIDEVCGDGIDNDGAGGDVLCPTDTFPSGCIDQDRDGHCANVSTGPLSGIDCDDTDRNIYPGRAIQTGCTSNEAKTCLSTGSYGSCSSGGWKPADCTTAYYISPSGNNSNAGTFASPWLTPDMFSDRGTGSPPAGYVTPAAGLCFIFRGGTYASFNVVYGTNKYWAVLHSKTGTSGSPIQILGYPGETAIIDMTATDITPMVIYQSNHIKIGPNLKVSGNTCYSGGLQGDAGCVSAIEGSNITLDGIEVSGNTGTTGNNLGGIHAHSVATWTGRHLVASDNIGDSPSAENNKNYQFYRGTNYTLTDSIGYYTTPSANTNAMVKHANLDSSWTVERNIFLNGQVTNAAPTFIAQNNYVEGGRFAMKDSGGPAFFSRVVIKNNTVRKSGLFYFDFTKNYILDTGSCGSSDGLYCNNASTSSCAGLPASIDSFVMQANVTSKDSADVLENQSWEINNYLPESTLKTQMDAGLSLVGNLWYNSTGAASFGYFRANNAGTGCLSGTDRGTVGASYSLAGVQSSLTKGTTDVEENPTFVADSWIASSTNSGSKGWNINWGSVSTPSARRKGSQSGSSRKGQG